MATRQFPPALRRHLMRPSLAQRRTVLLEAFSGPAPASFVVTQRSPLVVMGENIQNGRPEVGALGISGKSGALGGE